MTKRKPSFFVCDSRDEATAYIKYVHRAHPARRARLIERKVMALGQEIPVFIVAVFARPNVPNGDSLLSKGG